MIDRYIHQTYQQSNIQHHTQSSTMSHVCQTMDEQADNAEVFVLLVTDDGSKTMQKNCVKDSIHSSSDAHIINYVYQESLDSAVPLDSHKDVRHAVATSCRVGKNIPSEATSLSTFHDKMTFHTHNNAFTNGAADTFVVVLSGNEQSDRAHLQGVADAARVHRSLIVFAALDGPTNKAMLPDLVDDYQRVLGFQQTSSLSPFSRSNSTTNGTVVYAPANSSTGIFYKPEGAEYSIYYADTYLYITPDIFTGLLTFIFVTFVTIIGLSCLNQLQGASSFVMKPIPLGREN